MAAVTSKTFARTLLYMYDPVQTMVEKMCSRSLYELSKKDSGEVGSISRAITTSDGAWLTRGSHSKNFSFVIRDFLTGGYLYVLHLSQRGRDKVCRVPLYDGTSKSAEGYAASKGFHYLKARGVHVEVNWQDKDSTSKVSFREAYPDEDSSKIMICGGHAARAHTNLLQKYASQKKVTKAFADNHKVAFPELFELKCQCLGKKHRNKPSCGCLTEAFIRYSRINFFSALVDADTHKDPEVFRNNLRALALHHVKDEHVWIEDGELHHCPFHSFEVCGCGKCSDEDLSRCKQRKKYSSSMVLTCPLHLALYQVECLRRADECHLYIHPELGKGHSNLPEAAHNVYIRYRSKSVQLERLHYCISTNLAVLQSATNWASEVYGSKYYWLTELYSRLNLPVTDGMLKNVESMLAVRSKSLEDQKSECKKKYRVRMKKARLEENEERNRRNKHFPMAMA